MENYFEWDGAKYSIGINEMDDEHKLLISMMNDLQQLHARGAAAAEQGKALIRLASYTARHFSDEEAFMKKVGYPGLATHQNIHKQLLARIDEFAAEFKRSNAVPDNLFSFLRMWLKAHICGIDIKYAEHSRQAA